LLHHEELVAIPFRWVFTTNYDGVLESAHFAHHKDAPETIDADEHDRLTAFQEVAHHPHSRRTYVHLHGSVRRPEGVVLAREDYDARYYRDPVFDSFLSSWIRFHRLIFVGFSVNDEDFQFVLCKARALGTPSNARHFAILARPPSDREAQSLAHDYRGTYGIQPVFFDNSNGDYSGLWRLIRQLRADVDARTRAASIPVDVVGAALDKLLANRPELRDAELRELCLLSGRSGGATFLGNTAGDSGPIDSKIDDIFRLVTEGRPDEAVALYEGMEAELASSLTPRQRYRIQGNIGTALCSKGEFARAAHHYLRAIAHFSKSPHARGLEILGHYFAGDSTTAGQLAESLRSEHPEFARGWAMWVRTRGSDLSLDQAEAIIPEPLQRDSEVALALAELAARSGNTDAQVRHAQVAVTSSPEWVNALAALGAAVVDYERDHARLDPDLGPVPQRPEQLEKAEAALTDAIKILKTRDPSGLMPGLLLNRSVVRRLLQRVTEAADDRRDAFRMDPTEPAIVLAFSMDAEDPHDLDSAIRALGGIPTESEYGDQALFAQALLRRKRRSDGDLEQSLRTLRSLLERLNYVTPDLLRTDIARLTIQVLRALGRQSAGPALIAQLPPGSISESQHAALRARAHLMAEQADAAIDAARAAIQHLGDSGSQFDRRDLALLAQECGLHSDAVRLWRSILAPADVSSDSARLAVAAYHAREWRLALDVCAAVRAAGRTTLTHLEVEVEICSQSHLGDRALSFLEEWVATHPDDKRTTLMLSALALNEGKDDRAIFDLSRLPTASEVASAADGGVLVFVLRRGPSPQLALDAAYDVYRRFPEEHDAHLALISCVINPLAASLEIERPNHVNDNSAVLLGRDGEAARWTYVEPGPDPVPSRDEFSPSHDLVLAMLGLAPGDTFEYRGHTYRIHQIEGRVIRRAQDLADRYEENFPGQGKLMRFSVPTSPPADAPLREKLGEMYPVLEAQDHRRAQLESTYREQPLPIASYAKFSGRPLFNVVRSLVHDPTGVVRSDDGEASRWEPAIRLGASETLVIDTTILAGGLTLDFLDEASALGKRLLVPRSVVEEVRRLSLEVTGSGQPHRVIGMHKGQFFFREWSPDEMSHEVGQLETVLQFVDDHCEVVGGEATLDLSPDVRASLEDLIVRPSLDAIALARQHSCPLWTDDFGLQLLVVLKIPEVRTVWTQAVAIAAHKAGKLTELQLDRLHAAMIAHGYAFTRLSATAFTGVLRTADWRVNSAVGDALARNSADVAFLTPFNRFIVAQALGQILDLCPRRTCAVKFIARVLDLLGPERARNFARFIYRAPKMRQLVSIPGTGGAVAPVFVDLFDRPLKRLLRSWRSRDGEFRPR